MKYKLIASDMDETLLNDHHEICQRNIDLIMKAKEKGVKFVPATGRGYAAIQRDLKTLGLYDKESEYVISFNGGALTENKDNRILFFQGLSFEKTKEIFEFGLKQDVCIHIYTKDKLSQINNIINFNDVYSHKWNSATDIDLKRRKEAELLVKNDLPISLICGYIVYNAVAKNTLLGLGVDEKKIAVSPNYYF